MGKSGTPSRRGCRFPQRGPENMTDLNRREAIALLTAAPLAAGFPWTAESVREASARARDALARGTYEPKQFTATSGKRCECSSI